MKFKQSAALLAAAILLSACSSNSSDQTSSASGSQNPEAVLESLATSEEKAKREKDEKQKSAQQAEAEKKKAAFTETVIFDENGLKVTATGLEDGFMGEELKLLVENNTDQPYTVQARNVSINGSMVNPSMSVDVAPGKKSNDSMTFFSSNLENQGIDTINTLEFNLHIFNTDDWSDTMDSNTVTLTFGEGGNEAAAIEGDPIVDSDGVRIYSTGVDYDDFGGVGLKLHIENTTADQPVTVQVRDCSVDGFMINTIFSADVMPGKSVNDSILLMSSDLEENGIETIQSVELTFFIYHGDDIMNPVEIGPLTLTY